MFLTLFVTWLALALPQDPSAGGQDLRAALGNLGSFEFETRTQAARTLRRAPAASAAPILEQAALTSQDEYQRFRAFVLLSGMDQAGASRVAEKALGDRNDRLRTAAYQWYERHPRPEVLPRLLTALSTEVSEFVRPALTRAIAAHGSDPRAQQALRPLVMKGEDMFRGSVITAIGDYDGKYALNDIVGVARLEGPLQDDAVTALGKLGEGAARTVLAELQTKGPAELQPTVSASLCLLDVGCPARLEYLTSTLRFAAGSADQQPLLRAAVHGLGVLAVEGQVPALDALLSAGVAAPETARGPIALGIGNVALRNPDVILSAVEARQDLDAIGELLRDGFDMLSEDFEEEWFGIAVRRAFYASPENSPRRRVTAALIDILEF